MSILTEKLQALGVKFLRGGGLYVADDGSVSVTPFTDKPHRLHVACTIRTSPLSFAVTNTDKHIFMLINRNNNSIYHGEHGNWYYRIITVPKQNIDEQPR